MNCVSVHALIIPHKFFTAKDLCGIILYILRKGSKNGFMLDNNSAYINRSEELRLLGYGNKAPDGAVADILEECEKEIAAVAVPKYIFAEFETASAPIKLAGKSIAAHICECDRISLFAATLGGGVDRAIRTASVDNMTKALVLDCVAGAFIEEFCNAADEEIVLRYPDKFLTWRFAPGYGDFPLETQKELLSAVSATKKIGLSVNDSLILAPLKSVTAVIGISDKEIPQRQRGCAVCNMRETCKFRKDGKHCGF